jgi:MFS family permease
MNLKLKNRNKDVPWALIISSFVNKSGEMAINLLPMLLIERHVSTLDSSVILGCVKSAQVGGLFLGGLLTDVIGFRAVILIAYFLGFTGFIILPFVFSNLLIGIFATIAQMGSALFVPSARGLIREKSGTAIKQNMAWLRSASNLGQVVSAISGIVLGPFGLVIPFILDGMTSLWAFSISVFTLKNPGKSAVTTKKGTVEAGYFTYSVALAFYAFTYELGYLSFSGFGKLSLGNDGIRAFGWVLLINTFFSGISAVPASKFIRRPRRVLPLGMLLLTLSYVLLVLLPKTIPFFILCSFIMTCGEILLSVFSQTLLLVNSNGKSSRQYGYSLMIQASGKLAAGLCLFPLVLRSNHPSLPFLIAPVFFLGILRYLPKSFWERVNMKTPPPAGSQQESISERTGTVLADHPAHIESK